MAASRLRLNMDKTELIWTGTKHKLSKIPGCGRALTLGAAHVAQSDDVCVLAIQLSSHLPLDKHVNVVSAKFFFQLQLCRIRRSLHDDFVATLIHHKPSRLLRQSPDWRSKEDDRQVAMCPQLGSTNRLEHTQVRPGTHSFTAKSATLAGHCQLGSAQTLCPGFQMSA